MMWGVAILESVGSLEMKDQLFFWVAWFLVSSWVLREFYFSPDKEKLNKLCKVSFGIDLSVLILFFLPWLPLPQGGFSGWQLILQGNLWVITLFIFMIFSTFGFLTKNGWLLKAGMAIQIVSSVLFIAVMIVLTPGTITLTFYSLSPIIASLLLLLGNVVVLLLWQQLQLKGEKETKRRFGWSVVALPVGGLLLLIFVFLKDQPQLLFQTANGQNSQIERVAVLPEVQEFRKLVEENNRSTFHVELEELAATPKPYIVVRVFEVFPDHQVTFNRYRIDSKGKGVLRYNVIDDIWESVK